MSANSVSASASKRVENAVAVVCVDVDVGDAAQAVAAPQDLDRDAAIVEDAETGRVARATHDAARRSE